MRINEKTNIWDVMDIFNRKWCIVTMKDGRKERLYVVDVDYETFSYDMIIYNYTGSDSYGIDDIPFNKIDEIVINGDYL